VARTRVVPSAADVISSRALTGRTSAQNELGQAPDIHYSLSTWLDPRVDNVNDSWLGSCLKGEHTDSDFHGRVDNTTPVVYMTAMVRRRVKPSCDIRSKDSHIIESVSGPAFQQVVSTGMNPASRSGNRLLAAI